MIYEMIKHTTLRGLLGKYKIIFSETMMGLRLLLSNWTHMYRYVIILKRLMG